MAVRPLHAWFRTPLNYTNSSNNGNNNGNSRIENNDEAENFETNTEKDSNNDSSSRESNSQKRNRNEIQSKEEENESLNEISNKRLCLEINLDSIICPISREIFLNPVIASDGIIYEEDYLSEWLKNHNTSPLTNKEISSKTYPCVLLKSEIDDLVKRYPELKEQRHKIDNIYGNNINNIKRLINYKQFDKLLNYTDFLIMDQLFGDTPMIFTLLCNCNNVNIIKHIIDNCIDLKCKSEKGWYFMDYIARCSTLEILKLGLSYDLPYTEDMLEHIYENKDLKESSEAFKLICENSYNNKRILSIDLRTFSYIIRKTDDSLILYISKIFGIVKKFEKLEIFMDEDEEETEKKKEWGKVFFMYSTRNVIDAIFKDPRVIPLILSSLDSDDLREIINKQTLDNILYFMDNGFKLEEQCFTINDIISNLSERFENDIRIEILYRKYEHMLKGECLVKRLLYILNHNPESQIEFLKRVVPNLDFEVIRRILDNDTDYITNLKKKEIIQNIIDITIEAYKNGEIQECFLLKEDEDEDGNYHLYRIILHDCKYLKDKFKVYLLNYFQEKISSLELQEVKN